MLGALFPLFRPALHALDAETAHDLTLAALARLPMPSVPADDPRLATELGGLRLPNPVGLAAGFDKDARVPDALHGLGFGFVEVGGVTPLPQPGNPRPRAFRLAADRAIINRYGLNSAGMDAVAANLRRRKGRGVLGVNLGANKESDDRIGDYRRLTERLAPLVDFVTINVSSPNTPGLRDLQGRDALGRLVDGVMTARTRVAPGTRVLLKIAPDLDEAGLDDILAVALDRRIDALIVANTTLARPADLREAVLAKEAGGLSGKPLFRPSTVLLAKTYRKVGNALPLIGTGGISSGEDAVAKIAAGASAVALYSALVYEGPGLIGATKAALLRALEREGAPNVAALVGRNAAIWAEGGRD